jgi:hypothetical protein
MDKRLRKAQRLLKVQEQLHKMEEWKLASLQRQEAELRETQTVLIGALNNHEVLQGLFVESTARRLQALAAQAALVEQQKDRQNKVALDRALQVKRTERMIGGLASDHRRALEKKDYLSLLDSLATKKDASLP